MSLYFLLQFFRCLKIQYLQLTNFYYKATEGIFKNNLIHENSLVILEWDYAGGSPKIFNGFTAVKEKKYGRVGITILKKG